MRSLYFVDETLCLFLGDAASVLGEMPSGSVDCVVTSPPYYGKRDYRHPAQLGLEVSPALYVHNLCRVFAQLARVVKPTGTVWLNLGDSYSGSWGNYVAAGSPAADRQESARLRRYGTFKPPQAGLSGKKRSSASVRAKNLLGLPWRVVFGLQEQGWIVRNAVVWGKPNAMPESVRDRLSTRYELVFLLVRQERYWFDLDAVREPYTGDRSLSRRARRGGTKPTTIATPWPPAPGKYTDTAGRLNGRPHDAAMRPTGVGHEAAHLQGRNPGDVWMLPNRPFPGAHFAVQPVDIPLRCIAAGCPPGGTVLDPFSGAGTTLLAARALGRNAVGIDLRADYHDLALDRLGIDGIDRIERHVPSAGRSVS